MAKLPKVFHHFDKVLYVIFYFIATMFLILIYPKRWLIAAIALVLFGIIIEFAQEFSNKITIRMIGKAIHGRFNIEDVKHNLIGVVLGLIILHSYRFIFKSNNEKQF
jgi:glycopeptide antibiotics resistance protein